jgi:hypothetical protein
MQFRGILFLLLLTSFQLRAQQWDIITADKIVAKGIKDIQPDKFVLYTLDDEAMRALLWNAPSESDTDVSKSNTQISVGLADESRETFRIVRYDMMEPELAAKFPEIGTFYGVSVINTLKSIRIDYTIQGFRAVISSPEDGKIFIDHYQRNDKNTRIVYYKKDYKKAPSWGCGVTDEHIIHEKPKSGGTRTGDCQLRSYRLAQATTGEYSTFHGGTPTSVMSAVVNAINRVNQVYEAEVAVRLILVANTNLIFYYNAATDPYLNTSGDLNNNQNNITNIIGSANYDIGHLFGTGGGGVAGLGVVCSSGNKARGLTGSNSPVGDPFTIDYVAHEMGHQFGGNHTQNNNCNRNGPTAMEPGSASTIMGYAGICSPDVQSNSDAYFHAISLQEMKAYILAGGNCAATTTLNSTPPSITTQGNYSIPVSTPFVLTLNATDAQGHPMTYLWDQMDNAVATMAPLSTNTGGPTFRSKTATTSPSRYFPPLANVIANSSNIWEVLPSVARTINFRGVVRDFTGVAGCNSEIDIDVFTVNAAAGAFSVTSFNSASTWAVGDTKTITWNVAGSTTAPVNCANVDIFLSYDGGNTYPVTLASATPNDGTHNIVVPAGTTTQGRIMVKGNNHIFFDINNANITITGSGGGGTFELSATPSTVSACLGNPLNTVIGVTGSGGFSSPVTLSVSGLPMGALATFSSNPINPGSTSNLTIASINTLGNYNIVVNGVSGAQNKTVNVTLSVANQTPAPSLSLPVNGATVVSVNPVLSWTAGANVISYDLQVAYDVSFQDMVISTNINNNSYQPVMPLYGATTFYWRVRMTDNCGISPWSTERTFTTESCFYYKPTDTPVNISATGGQSVYSYLSIPDRGDITDLNITDLRGTIMDVSDLKFTLFNPSNISDLFWNMPCDGRDIFPDFDIKFDDEAANSSWPCPPTNGLTYIPSSLLSTLDGYQMKGSWKLGVQNQSASSDGILEAWEIKNCVNNFCRLTVDHTRASGAGSLVEAINCALTGDTIRFAANIQNDTFFLGNQNLVINKSIFIECDINRNIHITSNSASPTLVCTATTSGNGLKIKGLHIQSSNAGIGAVQNDGKLILDDVVTHKWQGSSIATIINNAGANTLLQGNCKVVDY